MLSRSESRKEIEIASDKITIIILNCSNCKHGPYKKKKSEIAIAPFVWRAQYHRFDKFILKWS